MKPELCLRGRSNHRALVVQSQNVKCQLGDSLFAENGDPEDILLCGFLLRLLIQAGCELNVQDHDGWTPLHAAAHWGVKEACSILAEALCDMDVRNRLVSKPDPLKGSLDKRLKVSVKCLGQYTSLGL